jgi:atypical dual specificity phosphatase
VLGRIWQYVRLQPVTWLEDERVGVGKYPRSRAALADFAARDVALLINLHQRPHPPAVLDAHGLRELHLPVPDFHCPTPEQLDSGIAAIERTLDQGHRVMIHCGGGLGRSGTLLACYLVRRGLSPEQALARIRAARPGSVETAEQEAAVFAYARRLR